MICVFKCVETNLANVNVIILFVEFNALNINAMHEIFYI